MSDQIFWIVTPQEESLVTSQKTHLAYRISNGHLLRGPLPANTRGGMMAISHFENANAEVVAEIVSECSLFGYRGIFAAITETPNQLTAEVLEELGIRLSTSRIPLIVPISYANICKHVSYYCSSSISGGSLLEYLKALKNEFSGSNLYIEHPLTRMRFTMPSLTGNGSEISVNELEAIITAPDVQAFYSPELFLNYCTYRKNGEAQFLLFDDARTLSAKIELCQQLGFFGQFLLYRELSDFYPLL